MEIPRLQGTVKRLVHAFVNSRLDYFNSVLQGVSAVHFQKLQTIQNAAARIVTRRRKYIYKDQDWILTANCTLGSACSHIAALHFKLEAGVHFKLNEPTAGSSELCAWKACRRKVTPAPLSRISFKQPKRGDLPTMQDSKNILKPVIQNYGSQDPTFGCNGILTSSLQLHALYPTAAVFTSIDSVTLSK